MLYIFSIPVSKRDVWGGVFQTETILPSNVRNVRAVCANAVPEGSYTMNRRSVEDSYGTVYLDEKSQSAQVGSVSISIGGTQIVCNSTPIYITSLLDKDSYVCNRLEMEGDGVSISDGALMRVICEETNESPFESYNGYTIKIYVEYDK